MAMHGYSSSACGHHSYLCGHRSFVMRLFNFHCKFVYLVKLLNFLISFPFSEAANLCLSAYTQAFVVAELDKLTPQKKFTEVLKLGFLPPKEKKDEPMVTEGGEMKVTQRPKGDDPVAGTSAAASEGIQSHLLLHPCRRLTPGLRAKSSLLCMKLKNCTREVPAIILFRMQLN